MVISNVGAVYEAIVMGGHRIDLARNFSTLSMVAEAIAIVTLLHFGFGLFAMAAVMAISEIGFVVSCYWASKRIVPEIQVSRKHLTTTVVRELLRFAGSYQIANILQVLYASIVPIALLRLFGPAAAGIYALTYRVASSALMLPDAFLQPILSGAAMLFATGSADQVRALLYKSFRATLGLGLFPLLLTAVFGPTIVFAWTGVSASPLPMAFWMVCAAGLFQSVSTLGLVLYRSSGKVLLDNIRLVSQIVILFAIAMMGRHLGFVGVLAGLAFSEFFGMLFMLFALTKAFPAFRIRPLLTDALRLASASALIVSSAGVAFLLPFPTTATPRLKAVIDLAKIGIASLISVWPALAVTSSLTTLESKAIVRAVFPSLVRSEPSAPGATS